MNQKIALIASVLVMSTVFLISNFNLPETYYYQGEEAKVVEVIDGDTVRIFDGDHEDTVRLIGVDAPETFEENQPSEFDLPHTESVIQCMDEFGGEATSEVEDFVLDEEVKLVQDPYNPERDPYDRKLAYVYLDGTTVGEYLLENGLGTVYPTAFEKRNEYESLEQQAKNKGKGVWSCD